VIVHLVVGLETLRDERRMQIWDEAGVVIDSVPSEGGERPSLGGRGSVVFDRRDRRGAIEHVGRGRR
jgi:hypothetical protein